MPEGRKFSPGQSGNPRGRPPHRRDFLEKLAEVDPSNGKSNAEIILDQVARRARQGSKWHTQFLFENALGKAPQQQINVNTEVTAEERLAGMTDEEITTRLLELTLERHRALKDGETVQ